MTRAEQIKQAIGHYQYGINYDIFKEPVRTFAELAVEALENELETNTNMRTAIIKMSIDDEDVVSKINVHGLTHCEFVTGCIAVLATVLKQAELSEYERDIFKIRLEAILKMIGNEVKK